MATTSLEREPLWREVFRTAPAPRPVRLFLAAAAGTLAVHGAMWAAGRLVEPSLETWSAQIAARAHAELAREAEVELLPPPRAAPVAPAPPPRDLAPTPAAPAPRLALREQITQPPAAPAAAARAMVRDEGPVELGDFSLVQGQGRVFAGGVTRADGSHVAKVERLPPEPAPVEVARPLGPVEARVPPRAAPEPAAEDRSEPVRLVDTDWSCPWPREADDEQIDEQSAVVRVTVGADGSVLGARIVADPGHGFGAAALACARNTRYRAARGPRGEPIRAESPPIRVRFTR